ncbi:hypothetical protein KEM60_02608 [Austwickia sp. TVS 96-490-7B]|uniref:MauE/DoxX family redox-associated membrane protein n=1 Tax=Austwickia sp. TVS 96-490-7B TaxID=2830843 RepID=UPI001D72631C|nr:MauE/DoxX family redox-associated membrane protein [Austwickia sp. TVS 96-490-7B]MBW3086390.1 hypothetical protein [Austwickia sp. TVS 96-490-7B]
MTVTQVETPTPTPSRMVAWYPWLTIASRLVLAVVWIYASVTKIDRPTTSARAVQAYQLFSFDLAAMIGQSLPIVELALGVLLLVGLFTRPSGFISAVLLVFFIIGIGSAWARGLRIDCGCFGGDGSLAPGADPSYWVEIVRDMAFLVCAGWLCWRPESHWSVDRLIDNR